MFEFSRASSPEDMYGGGTIQRESVGSEYFARNTNEDGTDTLDGESETSPVVRDQICTFA